MIVLLAFVSIVVVSLMAIFASVVVRLLLIVSGCMLFLIWVHLMITAIVSSGVGLIVFAALYEVIGEAHIGWVWAGAISAGLLVGITILRMLASKASRWWANVSR